MDDAGKYLRVGDKATTLFNGPPCEVEIIERDDTGSHGASGSGVVFRVSPMLDHGTSQSWYDSGWFTPLRKRPQQARLPMNNDKAFDVINRALNRVGQPLTTRQKEALSSAITLIIEEARRDGMEEISAALRDAQKIGADGK